MPTITVSVGSEDVALTELTRYTGEKFPLTFEFVERSDGTPLDISSATLTLELGSITKSDSDFTKSSNTATVTIDDADTAASGVYRGQVTADLTTRIVKSDPITLTLLSGDEVLTIDAIRAALWDLSADNPLLEDEEFPDWLLYEARREALDEFNGLPDIGGHRTFTESTFPQDHVYYWKCGTIAKALRRRALHYIRADMPYRAEGLVVQDKAKAKDYLALAQYYDQIWRTWIRQYQYNWNIQRGFKYLS